MEWVGKKQFTQILEAMNVREKVLFQFGWIDHKVTGQQKGDLITISLEETLVPTVIHEMLHFLYPKSPEYEIRRLENDIFEHLTKKEKQMVIEYMFDLITYS